MNNKIKILSPKYVYSKNEILKEKIMYDRVKYLKIFSMHKSSKRAVSGQPILDSIPRLL